MSSDSCISFNVIFVVRINGFPVRFAGRSWREKAASKRFDAMKNLMEE